MKKVLYVGILLILGVIILGCAQEQMPEQEQEEMEEQCFVTASTSSEAPDHPHRWCEGEEYTEDFCNQEGVCHKHKINEEENLAEAAGLGPHTHQLM